MQDSDSGEPAEAEVSLSVPLDTVCYIVARMHDLQGKDANTLDGSNPNADDEDLADAVLEDRPSDSVELEVKSVISDLTDEAKYDLVALMWLGRDAGDWAEMRALAEQEHTTPTADYLCGTPLVADYLLEGLNILGLDCTSWFAENE